MNYKNKWIPEKALEFLNNAEGRILDVGGGAAPFWKANHIVDVQPYDAERLAANAWGMEQEDLRHETIDNRPTEKMGSEQKATKVVRTPATQHLSSHRPEPNNEQLLNRWAPSDYTQLDVCTNNLPFDDKSFELGLCSHVLEDLRDPVRVVNEVFRVCRRVLVIGPSRLFEQMRGIEHPRYAGFYHHMWMMYERHGELVFRRKTPTVNLPGCHLSCPPFKIPTREAGSFMYLSDHVQASEEMFWSETEDAEELRSFVVDHKDQSGLFERDPNWKRPSFLIWKLRQTLFGVQ